MKSEQRSNLNYLFKNEIATLRSQWQVVFLEIAYKFAANNKERGFKQKNL